MLVTIHYLENSWNNDDDKEVEKQCEITQRTIRKNEFIILTKKEEVSTLALVNNDDNSIDNLEEQDHKDSV